MATRDKLEKMVIVYREKAAAYERAGKYPSMVPLMLKFARLYQERIDRGDYSD